MTNPRTRIKICGITRLEDALCAQDLGVDALGFVFVPASKRYISPGDAAEIARHIKPFVTVVGLFLNASSEEVDTTLSYLPQMVPQFHGQETARFCDAFGKPYLKAIGVGSTMPDAAELESYQRASAFLFDSHEPGALGGTGHAFDWSRLGGKMPAPLILAGGLNVDNVATAVKDVSPYAVDVSSGVESAKGIKCPLKMQQFVTRVAAADAQKT